ncbi:MAG: glucose 1-dehydrogenase [Armatimonadota bacterium]|nr:glucose 1-dehydrogenase [Armatimonadota bacterium]MDR7423382.1 glucose 1-dehydrogenase [Armatimonadota bacterium]MDR7454993.1 glucose 1-dehydrogenase [Armatimonadota bacterium]MDR7457121.1 glucose 1-dehydrogenase [Armatimonadota bacterium]MDR7496585.1 glucose 1-dehydrogenase [Armatimonadota bacterium]
MRLRDKVAIITGAASGQGREATLLFAAEGARVVASDLRGEPLTETVALVRARGGQAVAVEGDVADAGHHRRTVETALATFGRLDILYNNAAMVSREPDGDVGLEAIALETWERILAVNLTGVFLGCRAAIPEMARRGGGSVIITASVGALVGQRAHNHAYVASKAALLGLTRNLALEYAGRGVRVNCLAPGQIRTAMMAELYDDPARRAWFEAMTPMGRFGEAREVAAAALFLASDESSFVTGSVLVVDGGWTAL